MPYSAYGGFIVLQLEYVNLPSLRLAGQAHPGPPHFHDNVCLVACLSVEAIMPIHAATGVRVMIYSVIHL